MGSDLFFVTSSLVVKYDLTKRNDDCTEKRDQRTIRKLILKFVVREERNCSRKDRHSPRKSGRTEDTNCCDRIGIPVWVLYGNIPV